MDKVPVATTNLAAEKAAKLLKLFPECAGERGEVDFEKLKQTLADHVIEGDVERYQFTWPGKRAAMAEANVPTTKTLAPCEEESVDFAKTQNLYIEGDNLEVLKILRASYLGQVKMIYIDPPYNTGHDFLYRDHFSLTQKELAEKSNALDEDGNCFVENGTAEARYHSNWCSMMYPRLKLARDLLRDDGVLFSSIDDNEVDNLRKICNEVFGEENFVCTFAWQKRYSPPPDTKDVGYTHETIVLYRKSANFVMGLLPFTDEQVARYQNPDNDPRGPWKAADYTCRFTATERPSLYYAIKNPNTGLMVYPKKTRVWANSPETHAMNEREGRLWWGVNGNNEVPALKNYLSEIKQGSMPTTMLMHKDVGHTDEATKELRDLIPEIKFTPKPTRLLQTLIKIAATNEGELILDFFSGSATTAHAVMQLNAEDGGHRKFILVQLPEVCAEGSEAAKAGYKNICEIGKERIRRAGAKIKEEVRRKNEEVEGGKSKSKSGEVDLFDQTGDVTVQSSTSTSNFDSLDIGFRVLKVVDSPMVDASKPAGETTQAELSFSSVKTGVKDDALLFHTMLRLGIAPTDTIEYKTIEGNKVACVGGTQLVAALDAQTQMTNTFIEAIMKMNPGVAVFRDDTFRNNNALRISLEQTFKQLSKETKIEVI